MPSSTASCTPRTASPSTATPCANHRKNPASVASLTRTPPSEPLKPSMGAAVRDHRNAVRDRSESLSAINRTACPQSLDCAYYSDIEHPEFLKAYAEIVRKSCALLKPDRFACFVVTDVRNKRGNLFGFPQATIEAFGAARLEYYNAGV